MKLFVNDTECELTTECSTLRLETHIDDIDVLISQNNFRKIRGDNTTCLLYLAQGQFISIFQSIFCVALHIQDKKINYFQLTLHENPPTSQKRDGVDGIYFDDLCLQEADQLIKLVSTSLGRPPDKVSSQGANRARFLTKWGMININYHIKTPSVGIYLS